MSLLKSEITTSDINNLASVIIAGSLFLVSSILIIESLFDINTEELGNTFGAETSLAPSKVTVLRKLVIIALNVLFKGF